MGRSDCDRIFHLVRIGRDLPLIGNADSLCLYALCPVQGRIIYFFHLIDRTVDRAINAIARRLAQSRAIGHDADAVIHEIADGLTCGCQF